MNITTRIFTFTVLFWCVSNSLSAQTIERSVIATAGEATEIMSFTIGEPLVSPEAHIAISAGFQQLSFPLITDVLSVEDITHRLTYYPNPTRRFVHIEGSTLSLADTRIAVYTVDGRKLAIPTEINDRVQLDFINQASGTYYLLLEDISQHHIAKFKIVIQN